MKKVWKMLLLAGVFTVLLCASALAADPEVSGIYDVQTTSGVTVAPNGTKQESVAIGSSYTGDFYAGAEKMSVTLATDAEDDAFYAIFVTTTQDVPKEGNLVYIDQVKASGEKAFFETVYPSKLENGKTYYVYITGGGRTFDKDAPAATFKYFVPYTLGDVNDDGLIDPNDALLVLQYNAELISLDSKQQLAANVTFPWKGDSTIDPNDALRILQYNAELIHSWDENS